MKKPSRIILVILIGLLTFWLGFNYKQSEQPNEYYQVYLNDKVLGVVKSKKALEDYINKKNEFIKNKYNVEEVYAPTGLEIKKIESYQSKYDKVKDVIVHPGFVGHPQLDVEPTLLMYFPPLITI